MANIKDKIAQIRQAIFGKEVRESIASGIEAINKEVENTTARQDNVEAQFQAVLDETTDKDVISAPEITAARVGADNTTHSNLKARLDTEHQQVMSHLAQTAEHIQNTNKRVDYKSFYEGIYNRKQQKPTFTWIDDDGNIGVINRLKGIMEDLDIRITLAIYKAGLNREYKMTTQQVKDMIEFGCEVVSHGYEYSSSDRLIDRSLEEYEQDVKMGKQYTIDLGGNPDFYVIPFGESTPTHRNILAKYHKAAIDTTQKIPGGTYNTVADFDNMWIHRVSFAASVEHIKSQIDGAVANNGWIIMMSHVNSDGATDEKYKEIVNYALSAGMEYANLEEGFNRFGNLAQLSPTDCISADGTMRGKFNPVNFYPLLTSVPVNSPISFYQKNCISIQRVNSPDAPSYGLPAAGTIITYRHAIADDYAFQVYQRRWGRQRLVRFWYETGWGEWLSDNSPFTTETIRTVSTTISANSETNIQTAGSHSPNSLIIVQPVGSIPPSLSWLGYIANDGNYVIRLRNHSSSDIVLENQQFLVKIIAS